MNPMDIMNDARRASVRAMALRQEIHSRPELSDREAVTSSLVERTLAELGFEVSRPFGTAVVGLLRGGLPGRTVALRDDMDALAVQEQTGLP